MFTASKISSLIDKCTDDSSPDLKRPTRIEALSAFVWTRFMASTHSENDPNKIYTLFHAVNLRTRANPPLPDHYFGNISRIAITVPSMINGRPKCYEIVNQVTTAVELGRDQWGHGLPLVFGFFFVHLKKIIRNFKGK